MGSNRKCVGTAALIIVIAILFSSCSAFDFFSVDSLIRPPKLTGENALIEQTFESAVGSDVILLSPVSGEFRSSFIQFDIDNDAVNETLVFYAKKDSPNEARMHFLKFDGYAWCSAGDVAGNGSEVYSVAFYDLDQSNGFEIAVSWTVSDSKRIKTLGLYRFLGQDGFPDIIQLSVFQIYDYMVSDFDFDGQLELLYLMDNSSDQQQPFTASMIKVGIDDAAVHFVCELQLRPSVNLPLKMSCDIRNGRYRLYIDCVNFDGTYLTEILYYDLSAAILVRITDEAGNALSDQTLRSSEVYCTDVNNDHVIDVPSEIRIDNFVYRMPEGEGQTPLPLIRYMKCVDSGLTPLNYTYFYAHDASFRYRVDSFLSDYFCTYEPAECCLRFYASDAVETPVFSVACVSVVEGAKELKIVVSEPEVTSFTEAFLKQLADIL